MPDALALTLGSTTFVALAERALFWPAMRTMIIADLHLGKGDIFRAAGIAVPTGGTATDLARLSRLITAHGASSLVIVGDLVHAARPSPLWLEEWLAFRNAHRNVAMYVVLGNHDRHLDHAALQMEAHAKLVLDDVLLVHEPLADARFQINGHVHPVVNVPGIRGRWPAFHLREQSLTLPAFSLFTGGHLLTNPNYRWIACIESELLAHL